MTTDGGLDVIGDVHGCFDALEALLRRMGYARTGRAWRHPERRAVFVGDLIDRGPQQVEVVNAVRAMVDSGAAVMCLGNHEWNAIGWATPNGGDGFLRAHTAKNLKQHEAFLAQVGERSDDHRLMIEWFRSLPMWIEFDGLRVVHACWDPASMAVLGGSPQVTDALITQAHIHGRPEYDAVETLLKGIEVELPNGASFEDKDGHVRHHARIQWWREPTRTFRNSTMAVDRKADLPDEPLPDGLASRRDDDPRPVLFGHYWNNGIVGALTTGSACIDYSAVRGGELVAYRWSGEAELSNTNFLAVPGPRRMPSVSVGHDVSSEDVGLLDDE